MTPAETTPRRIGRFDLLLATGLGSGYSPIASGTAGSALAVVAFWALHRAGGPWTPFLALLLVTPLGIRAASRAEAYFSRKDPGPVVVDEIAGQWLTLLFLPPTPQVLIAGFFLFRFLDIWKPPPARWLERLGGGSGIMADDLMVAVYGNLILRVLMAVFPGPWGLG